VEVEELLMMALVLPQVVLEVEDAVVEVQLLYLVLLIQAVVAAAQVVAHHPVTAVLELLSFHIHHQMMI
jgi:hypothetical protein